jgi:hypothetical protein
VRVADDGLFKHAAMWANRTIGPKAALRAIRGLWSHPRPHRHASDERSLNMSILKSLFQMGLSVLRTALRVAAEIALTRIIELAIAAA